MMGFLIALISASAFAGVNNCPNNYPDGRTLRYSDGSMNYPDGRTLRYSDGSMNYPDGTTLRYSDGSMNYFGGRTLRYSDGSMNYPSGSTLRYSDGMMNYENGTTMCSPRSGGSCEVPLTIAATKNTTLHVRARSSGNNDYRLVVGNSGIDLVVFFDNQGNVTCRTNLGGGGHGGGSGSVSSFKISKPAADVRVDVKPGYDANAVRRAIEQALDSLN